MVPRPHLRLPRLGRVAALAGLVALAALGSARAQTPMEGDCHIAYMGDPQAIATCIRCIPARDSWACLCAELPSRCKSTVSKLSLAVTPQLDGAPIPGARVAVSAGGATLERVTDASGDASFEVPLDPKAPPKVIVKSVALGQESKLPGLSFGKGTQTFAVALDREVPLRAGETVKRVTVALPAAKLVITPLAYDRGADAWRPVQARVEIFSGSAKAFAVDAGPEARTVPLLVPPDKVGRDYRVQAATIDGTKLRDTTSLRVPAPGGAAFLTLHLADLLTQLERARVKLAAMLSQAYGPEIAARITQGVRFELGDLETPHYEAGVLAIPASYTLGFDHEVENLFHEWGHRVQEVLAPDFRASFSVGGKTDAPWAPDPKGNEWRAFDEGRADFYSQLFTAALRYPGDKAYNEEKAKPHVGKCATCPGYLASAMVAHYRDPSLYKSALEIARDLRDVHDEAARTLGHPPRTYAELVKAKESLVDRQLAEKRITPERAAAMRKQLRDVNARFKL